MNPQKRYDLLLISVDSPILLGIYENAKLTRTFSKEGRFSDSLPNLFSEILREMRELNAGFDIYYTNGPGNFSAIKLTHIFLQTLIIAQNAMSANQTYKKHKNIANHNDNTNQTRLFCTDAFAFSDSEFINAYGRIHFYKKDGEIHTTTLESKRVNSFSLPRILDSSIFSDKCEPLYILPAVQ